MEKEEGAEKEVEEEDKVFVPISGEGVVVIEEGWELREESYRVHDVESCSMSLFCLDSNHVYSPGLFFVFFIGSLFLLVFFFLTFFPLLFE